MTKKALAKDKFLKEKEMDEMDEDVMLKTEWQATHGDLKSQVRLVNSDSGSFWAGLFIARLIKSM